jgi:putative transposase
MVVLSIHLHQLRFKVHADAVEDLPEPVYRSFIEYLATVFSYKDQLYMNLEYAMPAATNILVITHRPKYDGNVERLQGYKFELTPDGGQARSMRRFAGIGRFVFNRALALQNVEREALGRKQTGYYSLCKMLTVWRGDPATPWLADAPIHATQQALKNLETGWTNHFESLKKLKLGLIKPAQVVQPPTFRKKGQDESFRYPDPKQIKLEQGNNRIFLPKLGWLLYRNSRKVDGELRNVTVSMSGGKYFVSIQTRREVEQPVHPSTSAVGIDVGIARFAAFSDGGFIEPLNSFKQHQHRLKRYQRMMARKQKFSNNWKKAKAKVTRIHIDIANARRDFLHKASTTISKTHAVVIVERLQVKEYVPVGKGHCGATRQQRCCQVRTEPRHPRSGMARIPHHAGLQTGMDGRNAVGHRGAIHQPDVPTLRARLTG